MKVLATGSVGFPWFVRSMFTTNRWDDGAVTLPFDITRSNSTRTAPYVRWDERLAATAVRPSADRLREPARRMDLREDPEGRC